MKEAAFLPGEYVHVRRQGHIPKLSRRYSEPLQILSQRGPSSFLLADGSVRNAAHLARAAQQSSLAEAQDGVEVWDDVAYGLEQQMAGEQAVDEHVEAMEGQATRQSRELPPTSSGRRRWQPDWLQY